MVKIMIITGNMSTMTKHSCRDHLLFFAFGVGNDNDDNDGYDNNNKDNL